MQMKIPYSKGEDGDSCAGGELSMRYSAHPESESSRDTGGDRRACARPVIGSPKLEELVRKKRMVIITSDHTRPIPSRLTMPILLRRIRAIPRLMSRSSSRPDFIVRQRTKSSSSASARRLFGMRRLSFTTRRMMRRWRISAFLPSGGRLLINRTAIDTDLLIAEGFIEPHFLPDSRAGASRSCPGIASGKTVMANHCVKFIKSDKARTGNLDGNPVHRDMLHAAQEAKLAFVLTSSSTRRRK